MSSAAFGVEWLALAQFLGFQVIECPLRWERGALLGSRGKTRRPKLSLLRELWQTRKRLGGAEYEDAVSAQELLHETSFHQLDRDVLVGTTVKRGAR